MQSFTYLIYNSNPVPPSPLNRCEQSKDDFLKHSSDFSTTCLTGKNSRTIEITICADNHNVTGICFGNRQFGEINETPLIRKTYEQLCEYFDGKREIFDVPYKFEGTDFQKKVWNALTKIPYGKTWSYKELAIAVGNEKACRAVGMANNKNPVSIIVPCHRVIGSNGNLTGYSGGLPIKKILLDLEARHQV